MRIRSIRRLAHVTVTTAVITALATGTARAGEVNTYPTILQPAAMAPTPSPYAPAALPGWNRPGDAPVVEAVPVADLPADATTFHYYAGRDGRTYLVGATLPDGSEWSFGATAVSPLPFNYSADWHANLRGRDMSTSNGVFCNDYRSTFVENRAADPYTDIQLVLNVDNGKDKYYETLRYKNDGVQRGWCWRGHSNHLVYHFDYRQPDTYWRVSASGTVDGS
jgi:hypothetical protein